MTLIGLLVPTGHKEKGLDDGRLLRFFADRNFSMDSAVQSTCDPNNHSRRAPKVTYS